MKLFLDVNAETYILLHVVPLRNLSHGINIL